MQSAQAATGHMLALGATAWSLSDYGTAAGAVAAMLACAWYSIAIYQMLWPKK